MIDGDDRNPIEVLADEFVARCRDGERPSVNEYAEQHPQWASEIRELFPTIVAMEQLKQDKLESGSGRAVLRGIPFAQLGDYRIIREIGRGGMGVVYEAEQESLGRSVAVKVLPQPALMESKQLLRFQREAQTAARLHHSNIVPVFGVGQVDGYHYYAMQYIRGVGLDLVLGELERRARGGLHHAATKQRQAPLSAAAAAQAMLDGSFAFPRKLGSTSDAPRDAAAARGPAAGGSSTVRSRADIFAAETDVPEKEKAALPPPQPEAEQPEAERLEAERLEAERLEAERLEAERLEAERLEAASDPPGDLPEQPAASPRALRGRRYWRTVARIGLQVADALEYAHSQGALHRDIKPANLLLDAQGTVWVTDFGLAKALEDSSVTRTGDIIGTLRYMAPEQFEGSADARSDVYSLGVTLYELLTLQPAFEESSRPKLIQRVMAGKLPRPRSVCGEVPRDLETIVLKALAGEPRERYQTAGALCEDLHRFLEDRTILARRPSPPERLWRWCRRNRAVAALTLTAFAAMLVAAVIGWVGYVRVSQKHDQAVQATLRAEANLGLTLQAFEGIFDQLAGRDFLELMDPDTDQQWSEPARPPVISPENAQLLQTMLTFYDRFAERNCDDANLQRETARANRRVGDIQQRLRNLPAAEAAYRRALELYGQLAAEDGRSDRYALEMATLNNDLGRVLWRRGGWDRRDEALQAHQQAAQAHRQAETLLLAQSAELADRPAARLELARTYGHLARSRRGGGPRSQREYQQKAMGILEALSAEDPENPHYRQALARAKIGAVREGGGPPRPGRPPIGNRANMEQCQEGIAILEGLVEEFPNNPEYGFELAEVYSGTAIGFAFRDDRTKAREQMMRAIELAEGLVEKYGNAPHYQDTLIRAHARLGMLLLADEKDRSLAVPHFEQAASLQKALTEQYPDEKVHRMGYAWSLYLLGEFYRRQERFEESRQKLVEAVQNSAAMQESSSNPFIRGLQIKQYASLAETLEALGQTAEAEQARQKAEAIREELGMSSDEWNRRGPAHHMSPPFWQRNGGRGLPGFRGRGAAGRGAQGPAAKASQRPPPAGGNPPGITPREPPPNPATDPAA